MGSALLDPAAHAAADLALIPPAPETSEELRQQVAARLAAHRERRLRPDAPSASPTHPAASSPDAHKSRVAAAVAQRYAHAQSYRAFLAAEAERAIQQARAAAEIAARNAEAVVAAQQQLLHDLAQHAAEAVAAATQPLAAQLAAAQLAAAEPKPEHPRPQALWPDLDEPARARREPPPAAAPKPRAPRPDPHPAPNPDPATFAPTLRVVLYDDSPTATLSPAPAPARPNRRYDHPATDLEALALDEEISFRQAPVFEEPAGPPMPLPANLIEFPRQLVAPRKVRPRYAEGPLRDEDAAAPAKGQLRIFEVESAQVSTQPAITDAAATSEAQWTSLWLDTPSAHSVPTQPFATQPFANQSFANPPAPGLDHHPDPAAHASAAHALYAAPLSRRLLAGSIDIACSAAAGLLCATAFAATTASLSGQGPTRPEVLFAAASEVAHAVPLPTLALDSVAALLLLSIALQALFFTFSDATPGMRLARIALCTFADDNPTRAAMRLRIPALVLSTALLGLGFWWALFDQDRLTWHDLLSRTYQRSY